MIPHQTDPKLSDVSRHEGKFDATELLELLDDIIFPAIAGDKSALEEAAPAWNTALSTLGSETIRETRSEYLRTAQSTWNYLCRQTIYQPERVLAVLKIMLLITSDDIS